MAVVAFDGVEEEVLEFREDSVLVTRDYFDVLLDTQILMDALVKMGLTKTEMYSDAICATMDHWDDEPFGDK